MSDLLCPFCAAPEKPPRDGPRAWFSCGTYAHAADLSQYSHRSDLCCAWEEINELTAGIVLWRSLATRFAHAIHNDLPTSDLLAEFDRLNQAPKP